jgi:hypothetical protein
VMLTDIRDEKGQLLAESLGTHAFY